MSHRATYWLAMLDPTLVKAGAFRVLFHLCDHHNDAHAPEDACFPSQETLMRKCALSNGGLNKILNELETGGLIRRIRTTKPGKAERRTYYILGCDMTRDTMQTPHSGDSPNSTRVETATKQTPLSDEANSTFGASKLHRSGEEPVKEPVRKECVSPSDTTHTHIRFVEFWACYPRATHSRRASADHAFAAAVDGGADPAHIIASAQAYAREQQGNGRQYIAHADTWLSDQRWLDHAAPAPSATEEAIIANARQNLDSPVPAIREAARDTLLRRGLA